MQESPDIIEKSTSIHISHVLYKQERPVMKHSPGESKNYHGHCILEIKKGSVEITSPMEGCPVHIQDGEIDMLVFTLKAGQDGCEFSIKRPMLESLK